MVDKLSRIDGVLKNLKTNDDIIEFLNETTILCDRLSLDLIKRIANPGSPFSVTDLPKLSTSKSKQNIALMRLYELEDMKLFASRLVKRGDDYVRVFRATPFARKVARIISAKK